MVSSLLENLDAREVNCATYKFIRSVLERFSGFIGKSNMEVLAQVLSSRHARLMVIRDLKTGSVNPDSTSFFKLLKAYAVEAHSDIARAQDPQNRTIGHFLLDLMACQGTPGIEDSISPELMRFWRKYINYVQSSVCAGNGDLERNPWVRDAYQMILKVVEACWAKSCWPDSDFDFHMDPEEDTSFNDFRDDVRYLYQAAYLTFGLDLFNIFREFAISAYQNARWAHLEASIFGFNALSDSFVNQDEIGVEGEEEDRGIRVGSVLSKVFSSGVFGDLTNITPYMASKVKLERLDMLHNYAAFFNKGSQFLPELLDSLFVTLKDPSFACSASKAIRSIGLSCRKNLASELGSFLEQYRTLFAYEFTLGYVKENVIGAIAAIIQALPHEQDKGPPLQTLLECTANDQTLGIDLLSTNVAKGRFKVVRALRCLVAMGKSLQVPDGLPIDVEDSVISYWSHGHGKDLQNGLISMIGQATSLLHQDGEVIEAICQILRTGYNESRPGLFVFAPVVTVEFVQSAKLNTARLAYLFETAGMMLAKQDKSVSGDLLQHAAYSVFNRAKQLVGDMDGMYQFSIRPELSFV